MALSANTSVENQEIIDRFKEYLTNTANGSIVYHSGNLPFPEFTGAFGGGASGKASTVTVSSIGADNTDIIASNIYNALLTETNRYTGIRKIRARLFVSGGGGNTGTRPTAGYVQDIVGVAFMSDAYLQSIPSVSESSVVGGLDIDANNLEGLLSNLETAYTAKRDTTVEITTTVCHASCHSSCHGSRSRR